MASGSRNDRARTLADELADRGAGGARIALVLGSGLGALADAVEGGGSVAASALGNLPASSVPGHAGRIVWGELAGVEVLVQEGRIHLYEGHSSAEVTRVVRAFAALGVRALVLTNSAGGLRPEWPPGTLMRIEDSIDFQRRPALAPGRGALGTPWDPALGAELDAVARAEGIALERGVYVGLLGPNYETPAEVRMLAALGGDAVGMSTVAEAAAARDLGVAVAGISCVTNPGAGLSRNPLSHAEVVDVARRSGDRFARLLRAALPALAHAVHP